MSREQRRWAPVIEVGALALLLAAANLLFARNDPGLLSLRPHPTLFLTLLVIARYGLGPGLIAAGVLAADVLLLVVALAPASQSLALTPGLTEPFVVLVPAAVLFGMLVQRHIDRRRKAETAARLAGEQAQAGAGELARLREVNLQLGEKIVRSDSSALALFRELKGLATLDREQLERAALRVLTETLRAEGCSVWAAGDRGLELRDYVGARPPVAPPLDRSLEKLFRDDVLAAHRVTQPLRRQALPLFVGRIRAGARGSLVGYLAIDRLPLDAGAEATRLFPLLVDWLSLATGHALSFEALASERGKRRAQ